MQSIFNLTEPIHKTKRLLPFDIIQGPLQLRQIETEENSGSHTASPQANDPGPPPSGQPGPTLDTALRSTGSPSGGKHVQAPGQEDRLPASHHHPHHPPAQGNPQGGSQPGPTTLTILLRRAIRRAAPSQDPPPSPSSCAAPAAGGPPASPWPPGSASSRCGGRRAAGSCGRQQWEGVGGGWGAWGGCGVADRQGVQGIVLSCLGWGSGGLHPRE